MLKILDRINSLQLQKRSKLSVEKFLEPPRLHMSFALFWRRASARGTTVHLHVAIFLFMKISESK